MGRSKILPILFLKGLRLKVCERCKINKEITEFGVQLRMPDERNPCCRFCQNLKCQKSRLKTDYNLTLEQYENMFNNQNGLCFICGISQPNRLLCVDHNHNTGKVRRLLCMRCNMVLGHVKEDILILKSMIEYIEEFG